MLGFEAFEISNEERDDTFNLRVFVTRMSALLLVPSALSSDSIARISSILCEPDDISMETTSFIYFTEHGNELHFVTF